jgi:uncharacterized protein
VIIDAHNHVWPDDVARRALSGNIPDMVYFGDGTVSGLAAVQDRDGIDRSVCLAVANTPNRVEAANRFVGSLDRSRFIPFGTVHPGLPPADNLASLRAHDVLGVKLHPVFQRYRLDDRALWDVLGVLEGELPVIVHVGEGGGGDGTTCTPAMVRAILDSFPGLDVIACHIGGYHRLEEANDHLIGTRCYLDTAWPPSLADAPTERVLDMLERHGFERVVFASDWPTADPGRELAAVRALGLDDSTTDAVLGGNLARLVGMG